MKKLLNLLSVLTVSGTAVPTTIAASSYKKQENINKNINLQTNNLKRIKRTTIAESGKLYWVDNNKQTITNNAYFLSYIQVPILSISLVPNASSSNAADVWIATENGVYYRKNNREEIGQVAGLNKAIQDIKVDNNGGAWILTETYKNRSKKDNNNLFHIAPINALKIDINNRNDFKETHYNVFRSLIQADILRVIFNNVDQPSTSAAAIHDNNEIVLLNKNTNYNGFIVPVIIEKNSQSQRIDLVFRTRNFYLEGFIVNNSYYYFSSADIKSISNVNSIPLEYKGDYKDLFINESGSKINLNIDWSTIFNSFRKLANYREGININIRNSLGVIAVVIAENWRFITMNDLINKKIIENDQYIVFGTDRNDPNNLYQIAMDWSAQGASVLSALQHRWSGVQSLPYNHYFDENHQIRLESFLALPYDDQHNQNILLNQEFLRNWRAQNPQEAWKKDHEIKKEIIKKWRNNWSGWFKDSILRYLPINVYSDQIYNRHIVRILFLIAINYAFNSCHQHGSDLKKRDINQNLNQEFCDLKSDVSKIKGEITSIQILDENTKGGSIQVGDAYVGTTEGLYLINKDGGVFPIRGTHDDYFSSIVDIKLDGSGGAYILNNQGKYFHLFSYFSHSKYEQIESSNLEQEIKLYYDNKQQNRIIHFAPTNSKIKNFEVHTINLGPINPNNYKKIEFLGDVNYGKWGTKVIWGGWNYVDIIQDYDDLDIRISKLKGKNIVDLLKEKNNILQAVILNKKVVNQEEAEEVAVLNTQVFEDWGPYTGWIGANQKLGLTWYQENGNYYLQVIVFQKIDWRASESTLDGWIKIGNGVRLYND